VTTSTITWHPPTDPPLVDINVLMALRVKGLRTTCEGFLSHNGDGRLFWYDVTAQPVESEHVEAWAELPEYVP